MKQEELVSEYEKFKDKFKLPDWNNIDEEFFLSFSIAGWRDIPNKPLIYILNRMMDYYNSWINFCHTLINGNPQSMIMMREAEFFSDEEKRELISVMTELTIMTRKQTVVNLENKDEITAEFISEVYNSWIKLKPELLKFSNISLQKWKEEKNIKK